MGIKLFGQRSSAMLGTHPRWYSWARCDRPARRRAAASVPGYSSRVRPAARGNGGTARPGARRSVLPGPVPSHGATPSPWRAGNPFGDPRKAIRYDGPSPPEVPYAGDRPAPWKSGRTGRRRAAGGNGCWWTRFDMYRTVTRRSSGEREMPGPNAEGAEGAEGTEKNKTGCPAPPPRSRSRPPTTSPSAPSASSAPSALKLVRLPI